MDYALSVVYLAPNRVGVPDWSSSEEFFCSEDVRREVPTPSPELKRRSECSGIPERTAALSPTF